MSLWLLEGEVSTSNKGYYSGVHCRGPCNFRSSHIGHDDKYPSVEITLDEIDRVQMRR